MGPSDKKIHQLSHLGGPGAHLVPNCLRAWYLQHNNRRFCEGANGLQLCQGSSGGPLVSLGLVDDEKFYVEIWRMTYDSYDTNDSSGGTCFWKFSPLMMTFDY